MSFRQIIAIVLLCSMVSLNVIPVFALNDDMINVMAPKLEGDKNYNLENGININSNILNVVSTQSDISDDGNEALDDEVENKLKSDFNENENNDIEDINELYLDLATGSIIEANKDENDSNDVLEEEDSFELSCKRISSNSVVINNLYGVGPGDVATESDIEIQSIVVLSTPSKFEYDYGEEIDLAGLSMRVTYNDDSYEDIYYNDTTKEDFTIYNNSMNASNLAKDLSYIKVRYKGTLIKFNKSYDNRGNEIKPTTGYPIVINNTPDFENSIVVLCTENGAIPLSLNPDRLWDMSKTYEYNMRYNTSPIILYKEEGDALYDVDDIDEIDWEHCVFCYDLGMGIDGNMIGYDTIRDVVFPEGIIKGEFRSYGNGSITMIRSDEDMSFYFRNNYIVINISRQDNDVYFYRKFSGILREILVKDKPYKLNYIAGDKFDPTGLIINARNIDRDNTYIDREFAYNDKYKDEFQFNPSINTELTTDDHEVIVSFRGFTCTIPIEVSENTSDLVKVTFDYDDGNKISTVSIPRGSKVLNPGNPTKKGYQFLRWASILDYSTAFDFNTEINEDITIEAVWRKKRYAIHFHQDLNSPVALQFVWNVPYDVDFELPYTMASLSQLGLSFPQGKQFDTWFYPKGNRNVSVIRPDDSVESYELYAKWEPIKYTLKYNPLRGELPSGTEDFIVKEYGKPIQLATPSRPGYIFDRWYRDYTPQTGGDGIYGYWYDGTGDLPNVNNGDTINIYARWIVKPIVDAYAISSPSKLDYHVGERIDLTGLKIRLVHTDNSTSEVTYGPNNQDLFSVTTDLLTRNDIVSDRCYVGVMYSVDDYWVPREKAKFVIFDNETRTDLAKGLIRGYKINILDINDDSNDFGDDIVLYNTSFCIGSDTNPANLYDTSRSWTYKELLKAKAPMIYYKKASDQVPTDYTTIMGSNRNNIGTYIYGMDEETNAMIGYPGMRDIYIPDRIVTSLGSDKYIDGYYRGRYFRMDIDAEAGLVYFTPKFGGLDSIEIKTNPIKLDYVEGEDCFDPTGLVINAVNHLKDERGNTVKDSSNNDERFLKEFKYADYADEITFNVDLTTPLGYDNNQITVNFRGKTCTLNLNILASTADRRYVEFENGYDGTIIATRSVVVGNKVSAPSDPIRPHYDFVKWVKSGETNAFDFVNIVINSNMRLIAIWEPHKYSIQYNTNGGTLPNGTANPVVKTYNDSINLASPSKVGYSFEKWYQNYDIVTNTYTNPYDGRSDFANVNKGDIKDIYAKWNENAYDIILSDDGGTYVSTYSKPTIKKYTDSKPLPTSEDISKEGYVFKGWYDNENFTGSVATIVPANVEGPYEYWLKWNKIYVVTFDLKKYDSTGQGKDIGATPTVSSQNIERGLKATKPPIEPTAEGHSFVGWYHYDTTSHTYGVEFDFNNETITADTTIYAKWTKNTSSGGSRVNTSGGSRVNTSGGSSNNGGGGGGGGGRPAGAALNMGLQATVGTNVGDVVTAAVMNIITTVSIDSTQTTWLFDPTMNVFKLNYNINGQIIPALNGFYAIDSRTDSFGSVINAQSIYYFDASGKMVTGFVKTPDSKTYFFENAKTADEGKMVIGWKQIQNDWYYFGTDGAMLVNAITPDGYRVDTNGKLVH